MHGSEFSFMKTSESVMACLPHSQKDCPNLKPTPCAGIGLGAYHVTKDTCLYTDSYVVTLAAKDHASGSRAALAVEYYLGRTSVPDDDVLQDIFGLNSSELAAYEAQPQVRQP